MTYDAYQTSQISGEPLTLFRFIGGSSRLWLLTSERAAVLRGSEVYEPEAIRHSDLEQNVGESPTGVDIVVPTSSDIAQQFLAFLPVEPITVIIYSKHRPDAQYVTVFVGECSAGAHDDDGTTTIRCEPLGYKLERKIPWPCYSATCNWAVYGEGCGVSKDAFKLETTVAAASGFSVSSPAIAGLTDGWFNAGVAVRTNGETRWIVAHIGDEVILVSPFTDLQDGEALTLYAGCDGYEITCLNKFANLNNFSGFPDVPTKNPYKDNVFGTATPGVETTTNNQPRIGTIIYR